MNGDEGVRHGHLDVLSFFNNNHHSQIYLKFLENY
ncbi:hypothetical protein STAR110904_00345 [Staphylococcus argensis]